MSFTLLVYSLFFLFGFIGMIVTFTPISNKYMNDLKFELYMSPIWYLFTFFVLGTFGAYFLIDKTDFIEPLTPLRAFLPIFLAILIFCVSQLNNKFVVFLTILLSVTVTVFLQPVNQYIIYADESRWLVKTLVIILFSIFCYFYYILNFLPQILIIPSVIIILGVSLIGGLGGAPIYLGVSSIMFGGALLGYMSTNMNQVKITLDKATCTTIAYIISSILLLNLGELSFSATFIFTILFWAELIIAICNKYINLRTGDLADNTNYALGAQIYSMQALVSNMAKIGGICLFLGWFQLFSVNFYSILIISFAIVIWLNNSFGRATLGTNKSIKEINKEFIASFKNDINEAKESFTQIKNKKDK